MTKGPDRRAREPAASYYLLPIRPRHSSPRAHSSLLLSRALHAALLLRQRTDLALVLVSSQLISLCRFFQAPSLVIAARSLSIIFCFFFFFFFLQRYARSRFMVRLARRLLIGIIRNLRALHKSSVLEFFILQ